MYGVCREKIDNSPYNCSTGKVLYYSYFLLVFESVYTENYFMCAYMQSIFCTV